MRVFLHVKGKVEQLAADWKILDGQLRESLQAQVSPWTHHQHVVQHQQLGMKTIKKRGFFYLRF